MKLFWLGHSFWECDQSLLPLVDKTDNDINTYSEFLIPLFLKSFCLIIFQANFLWVAKDLVSIKLFNRFNSGVERSDYSSPRLQFRREICMSSVFSGSSVNKIVHRYMNGFYLVKNIIRPDVNKSTSITLFCRCNKITDFCIIYDKVRCVGFGFVYQRWISRSVIIPKFNIFSISFYPNNTFSKQVPLIYNIFSSHRGCFRFGYVIEIWIIFWILAFFSCTQYVVWEPCFARKLY